MDETSSRQSDDNVLVTAQLERGVLKVVGEIDMHAIAHLMTAAREAIDDGRLVVDCSEVSFIDSSGLNMLLWLNKDGVEVHLMTPSPAVVRLLDMTKLTDLFPVVDLS